MRQILTGKFLKMSKFIVLFGAIKICFKERKMNEFVTATEKRVKELKLKFAKKRGLLKKIEEIAPEFLKIIAQKTNGDDTELENEAILYIKQKYGIKLVSEIKHLISGDFYRNHSDEAIHIADILMPERPIISAEIEKIKEEILNLTTKELQKEIDFKKESIERFKEEIKDLQARLKMKKAIVEAYLII